MKKTQIAIIGIAWAAIALGAAAQNVYRCGNAYSQAPCTGGQVVDINEPAKAPQPAAGPSAAERDIKAADLLEKDRLKLEARAAPAYIPPDKEPTRAAPPKRVLSKPEKPKYFTAIAPAKPGDTKATKAKKKSAKKAAKA